MPNANPEEKQAPAQQPAAPSSAKDTAPKEKDQDKSPVIRDWASI